MKRLNPIKLKQMEDRVKFTEEEIPRLEEQIAAAEERWGTSPRRSSRRRMRQNWMAAGASDGAAGGMGRVGDGA